MMSLRTKLLTYTLGISTLIIIVGMTFYMQLKNLIEPLTPQSIPLSVEALSNTIKQDSLIDRLRYRQLQVEFNLRDYVYSGQLESLQEYYMNQNLLLELLSQANQINADFSSQLQTFFFMLDKERNQIIQLMQQNKLAAAKRIMMSSAYAMHLLRFKDLIETYHYRADFSSNEEAVATAKIAVKHTTEILHASLTTTLVIFIDAIIVSLMLVYITVRTITRPLNLLRDNVEKMNTEKHDNVVAPELLRIKGEIGELARSFSTLLTKLRTTTVLRDELLVEIERRKTFENQLQKTAIQLRESNRDLDQFAYAASHDLRAPLRAIESLTTWIKDDCYQILPPESRKHIDLIIKRVHRLDMLIAGILEFSRAAKIENNLEQVSLKDLLTEIVDSLSPPKHIQILFEKTLPVFNTNKIALTQVFLNLLSNAIKYNDKAKGDIHIGYQKIENFYKFHVSDNGCGIEPQFQQKIFEIFQTLQSRDAIESSGIGLAIVKKIVEAHGGKIWLTSFPEQGTTFYFTWPIEITPSKN